MTEEQSILSKNLYGPNGEKVTEFINELGDEGALIDLLLHTIDVNRAKLLKELGDKNLTQYATRAVEDALIITGDVLQSILNEDFLKCQAMVHVYMQAVAQKVEQIVLGKD